MMASLLPPQNVNMRLQIYLFSGLFSNFLTNVDCQVSAFLLNVAVVVTLRFLGACDKLSTR